MCVSDHCLVFSIDIDSGKKFEIIKKFKKDLMLTVKKPHRYRSVPNGLS